MSTIYNLSRLRNFITAFAEVLDTNPTESELLDEGGKLLKQLVSTDDWLPAEYALPHPQYYQQYLLHADSRERFSIVSFVWGPGQSTPIHNHTTWGLIGMLRGSEFSQGFEILPDGTLAKNGDDIQLSPGTVEAVSPEIGDVHQVRNAFNDQVSISIHVYGANIGAVKRNVFAVDGTPKAFISGYSNTHLPNVWDRSAELRKAE
jgi:predicted metal-dependent enzyme (double-stranded beta helix superfamily)